MVNNWNDCGARNFQLSRSQDRKETNNKKKLSKLFSFYSFVCFSFLLFYHSYPRVNELFTVNSCILSFFKICKDIQDVRKKLRVFPVQHEIYYQQSDIFRTIPLTSKYVKKINKIKPLFAYIKTIINYNKYLEI